MGNLYVFTPHIFVTDSVCDNTQCEPLVHFLLGLSPLNVLTYVRIHIDDQDM